MMSQSQHTADTERILLQPYDYLLKTPGKSFRTTLLKAFQRWIPINDDKLDIVAKIIEVRFD
jgi:geranylgeranyl diphosphate synthase, type III